MTASKHRNIFCLNEAIRAFITRFFTLLLGALRRPLTSACAAKTCAGAKNGESLRAVCACCRGIALGGSQFGLAPTRSRKCLKVLD